jgi:hypothetical protein
VLLPSAVGLPGIWYCFSVFCEQQPLILLISSSLTGSLSTLSAWNWLEQLLLKAEKLVGILLLGSVLVSWLS